MSESTKSSQPPRHRVPEGDPSKNHLCPMCSHIHERGGPCHLNAAPVGFGEPHFTAHKTVLRPRNSDERKAEPIFSGVLKYFPDALAAVARVSKKGNDKHNPGQPLHWARGKSTDQMDCVTRHSMTPEELDPDTGEFELAHGAWRILAQLQLQEEKRLAALGIKPYSGIVP